MVLDRSAATLDGVVAVVTGGGAGIGRGIAQGLAAFGARVAVWERDEATCRAAAAEVGGLACVTDVRDEDQVDAALAATVAGPGVAHRAGQQRGRRVLVVAAGDQAQGLGRAVAGQPGPGAAVHPAGGPGHGGGLLRRQHRQRGLHRGHAGRARLRGLRRGQGRGHQPHPHRGAGAGAPRHPGQLPGPRHHPDRGPAGAGRGRSRRPGGPFRRRRARWAGPATWTRWRAPRCSSPRACPAT